VDCLLPPLLVGPVARVCVDGMPPIIVAVAMVIGCVIGMVVVVVGSACSLELCWLTWSCHGCYHHGCRLCLDSFRVISDKSDLETMQSNEDGVVMDKGAMR